MSSAPIRQVLASTSFRLALVCAGVILLAFTAAGAAAWFVTKSAAEQASRQRIETEMNSLIAELREEGLAATVAAVESRQHSPGSLEYRVTDMDGRILAGELDVDAAPGWSTAYLRDSAGARSPDLVLFNRALEDGGNIVIAEDLERTEWVRYSVMSSMSWIGAMALVIALVAGFLAARRALRDMDDLIDTMDKVGAGDLSVRVPARPGVESDVAMLGRGVNSMLERIDDLVSNLRRVSKDIAHDLRTPLTHVRQQLDEAIAANSLDGAKAAATAAQARIDDLMRVFAAILRLGEIDSGASKARFARVDLAALVERVTDAYRPDVEAAGRTLQAETAEPATISGDADLLAQALANLLDNALTHTPAGTTITVKAASDEDGVSLEVTDAGAGVPAGERERVLRPFVRLDASRTLPGVGLGLSIVESIARLHGAELTLEDAEPGLRVALVWTKHAAGRNLQLAAS